MKYHAFMIASCNREIFSQEYYMGTMRHKKFYYMNIMRAPCVHREILSHEHYDITFCVQFYCLFTIPLR